MFAAWSPKNHPKNHHKNVNCKDSRSGNDVGRWIQCPSVMTMHMHSMIPIPFFGVIVSADGVANHRNETPRYFRLHETVLSFGEPGSLTQWGCLNICQKSVGHGLLLRENTSSFKPWPGQKLSDTVDGRNSAITSWYGKYPIIYRVSHLSTGAGFLPSTVGGVRS